MIQYNNSLVASMPLSGTFVPLAGSGRKGRGGSKKCGCKGKGLLSMLMGGKKKAPKQRRGRGLMDFIF